MACGEQGAYCLAEPVFRQQAGQHREPAVKRPVNAQARTCGQERVYLSFEPGCRAVMRSPGTFLSRHYL